MNRHQPGISIITPVYNINLGYLAELAECLFSQTLKDYEWLIVDDGSSSVNESSFLKIVSDTGIKVKIIKHNENKGLPAARNTGIRNASGEYLFFIDGDDLIHPTTLEKFLYTLEVNPDFQFVNAYVKGFGAQEYYWKGGFHNGEIFLHENRNTSCFMAKKAVFEKLNFDENLKNGCEDWDFWLHAASLGLWGYTIPEFLFCYRRSGHTNKWETLRSKKQLEETGRLLRSRYIIGTVENKFPQRSLYKFTFGNPDRKSERFTRWEKADNLKNVLFIIPWMEVGGADKFNLDLARGLKERGWSVFIICTAKGENVWFQEFEKITQEIYVLNHYAEKCNYHKIIEKVILSKRIQIIFLSNSMYGYYSLPYIRNLFPFLPVVDYLHCEENTWCNGGYPAFSLAYSNLIAKSLVTSKYLKQWYIKRGGDEDKTEVIYINIDTTLVKRDENNRDALRKELGIGDDTAVLLYIARLTPQKQPGVLVASINKLYCHNRNFRCIIIGDGPEREQLIKAIRKSSASANISYLGNLPNEEVKRYMDAADIFFLPSAYEGIALSIYEAMSKKLAIVGANVGGQEELVTTDCGRLVQGSSPEKEAVEYAAILNEYIIELKKTRQVGEYNRIRVEKHFDIGEMINRMDILLTLTIRNYLPDKQGVADGYLVTLNTLLMVSDENDRLVQKLNSSVTGFLLRNERYFQSVKRIYKKLKRISNR
jgi:glycosyltransferase involved in cell wall biosynthesis